MAWFGRSTIRRPGNDAPVIGDVSRCRSHVAMASRSYVCPSAKITGSTKSSWVMGQEKCFGTFAPPSANESDASRDILSLAVAFQSSLAVAFQSSLPVVSPVRRRSRAASWTSASVGVGSRGNGGALGTLKSPTEGSPEGCASSASAHAVSGVSTSVHPSSSTPSFANDELVSLFASLGSLARANCAGHLGASTYPALASALRRFPEKMA